MSRNKGITYVYTLFFKPRGQKAHFISKFTLKLWNALTVKGNDLTMERSDWNPKRGSTPVSTVRLFIKNIFLIITITTTTTMMIIIIIIIIIVIIITIMITCASWNLENGLDKCFFFPDFRALDRVWDFQLEIDCDEIICQCKAFIWGECNYPFWMTLKPRKGDFWELKCKKFPGVACPWMTPLKACIECSGNLSVFILDPHLKPCLELGGKLFMDRTTGRHFSRSTVASCSCT